MDSNIPQPGTPEYDDYMIQHFGPEYELGFRIGFGKRFAAFLIDAVIASLVGGIISVFVLMNTEAFADINNIDWTEFIQPIISGDIKSYLDSELGQAMNYAIIATTLFSLIYYAIEIFKAQTPGKMVMNIIVGNENRERASQLSLMKRYIVKNATNVLGLIGTLAIASNSLYTSITFLQQVIGFIILVGFFFVFSKKKQTFHDLFGKTAVYSTDGIKN